MNKTTICPMCKGTGKCAECHGAGQLACVFCDGLGCADCAGSGRVDCVPCDRSGKCWRCDGKGLLVQNSVPA